MNIIKTALVLLLPTTMLSQHAANPILITNNTEYPVTVLAEKGLFAKESETIPVRQTKAISLKNNDKGLKTTTLSLTVKYGANGASSKFTFTHDVPYNPYEPITLKGALVKKANGKPETEIATKKTALAIGTEKEDYTIHLTLAGKELEKTIIDFIFDKAKEPLEKVR